MNGRWERTEAIVWGWSGAVLFLGSVTIMALAYFLYATVPDLDTVTDAEGLQDLNERFRLISRLIDIGQPGAVAGAIGLFAGAALLRSPGGPYLLRVVAGSLLAVSTLLAVLAGWRSTSASFGTSSTPFEVWAWVEAGAWLGIGAAGILLFLASSSALPRHPRPCRWRPKNRRKAAVRSRCGTGPRPIPSRGARSRASPARCRPSAPP